MFAKSPFTYFEITSHPNTFCKNNPTFFCNYKNTLFYLYFKFSKASHKHAQALHLTNTYFTLTKYRSSITSIWTVTASPPKKNLVPRFGRKTLKGRETNHPLKVTGSNYTRENWGWWRAWRDEYNESMKRWYIDKLDKIREEKVIKFS
jgi:hypothetical protein